MKKKSSIINISITIIGFILAVIIGYIDYKTGRDISIDIFYLLPVAMVVWFTELPFAVFISFAGALIWYASDASSGYKYPHPAIIYWNAFAIFGILIITALLLDGLKKSLIKEKALARTDYLTELANRRSFFEAADAEINRSGRNKLPFTMAYIDTDNFKSINDNFGHATGDRVLKIIAMGIKKNIRKMDTAARIGGDEFAVLLPETNSEAAKHAMDKIYMLLSEAMKGLSFPITFSVGVVTFANPPKDADEMIKITDELMYSVKAMGKNNIKYEIN